MNLHTPSHIAAAAFVVSTLAAPSLALAEDGITTKFSGFGTFGMVHNSAKDGQYRSSSTQYRGAGANADFGVDTRGGLQGDVQFNDMFSATGQVLSMRRGIGDFKPEVEWLFGQAKLGNGFNLRLGRMGVPAYMVSVFHGASHHPRHMKRVFNSAAASGTEVGSYLVSRTRVSVGPAASRAPRTVAWGFAPLSTHFRLR